MKEIALDEDKDGLEEIIKNKYAVLSGSERMVANFVLESYEEAAFMNISQLARVMRLSEATLSRFVRHLGFDNYALFQENIQNMLRRRLTPRQKIERTVAKLNADTFTLTYALEKDAEHLKKAFQDVDEEAFQKASEYISKGRRVFLAGLGISRSIVDFLEFRFRRGGLAVEKCDSPGVSFLEHLAGISREDVLLVVGFFRIYPELLVALEWCREQGVPSVAITESLTSLLGSRAMVTLVARRGPVGELNSLAPPMTVANALTVKVALIRRREAVENAKNMDRLFSLQQKIYENEVRKLKQEKT